MPLAPFLPSLAVLYFEKVIAISCAGGMRCYLNMCLFVPLDLGGIWLQRNGAESARRAAFPECRAAGPHHLFPLPRCRGDVHVVSLSGGEAHQAAP